MNPLDKIWDTEELDNHLNWVEVKIPIDLCTYVLQNKLSRQFRLYMLLKMCSYGKTQIRQDHYDIFAKWLKYKTTRSVKNHLKWLVVENWVGFNPRSNYFFIRGFEYLQKIYLLTGRCGVWFAGSDIGKIHSFLVAAVIGYLINVQRKKYKLDRERGRSNQGLYSIDGYYGVSARTMANILHISPSTAWDYIKKAINADYITYLRQKRLIRTHDEFKTISGSDNISDDQMIFWNNGILLLLPDMYWCDLKFGLRKKIDQ